MLKGPVDIHSYRYERKFFISELTIQEVESFIKINPAMFSEIYHKRFVNNIYFDSVNLKSYFDNIVGSVYKKKIRIRWYGELFGKIEKPVLEIKIKNGLLGKKESYPLHPFKLNNNVNVQSIIANVKKSIIPEIIKMELQSLEPVLLNRYSRKYFQSVNRDYRITVDTDLIFYQIGRRNNSFLNRITDDVNVILELKYNQNMDDNVNFITNHFPFRLTKSSKFVSGIAKTFI